MATSTKSYKIRKFQNGRNRQGDPFINFSLTIPSEIAESLPAGMKFSCELVDEGILFRPVESQVDSVELPDWATKNGNGAPAQTAPRPARKTAAKKSGARARPAAAKKSGASKTAAKKSGGAKKSAGRKRPGA
jgi:hypothetical protein